MRAGSDKQKNLLRAQEFIRQAAKKGAKLFALPEVFLWRGPKRESSKAAEPIPGPSSLTLCRLAKELGVYIIAGSMIEVANATHSYNTSIVINAHGKIIAKYRKIHLFDVDIPGGIQIKESDTKKPGNEIVTCKTPLGTIGLSICYDLRFPELYRQLSQAGAQILAVPAAFTSPTGKAHWEPLLRARAIENQCYIIAPNQVGRNVYGFNDYGHSMIIDPWGNILAKATKDEGLVTAEIDLSYLLQVRQELPSLAHKRL